MNFDRETIEKAALNLIAAAAEVGAPIALAALTSDEAAKLKARAVQAVERGLAYGGHALWTRDSEKAGQEWAFMILAIGQMLAILGVAEANLGATTRNMLARVAAGWVEGKIGA